MSRTQYTRQLKLFRAAHSMRRQELKLLSANVRAYQMLARKMNAVLQGLTPIFFFPGSAFGTCQSHIFLSQRLLPHECLKDFPAPSQLTYPVLSHAYPISVLLS